MSIYKFGVFTLDYNNLSLKVGEHTVDASDKVIQFLVMLIEREGELVSKDDIFDQLWQGQVVSEASLSRLASDTRQLLAEHDERPVFKTVRGKGFRFEKSLLSDASIETDKSQNKIIPLVATILIALGFIVWLLIPKESTQTTFTLESSGRILVLPTQIETSDDQDAWVKYGLMTMLNKTLEGYPTLSTVSVESTLVGLSSLGIDEFTPQDFDALCSAMSCDWVIQPKLSLLKGQATLSYQLINNSIVSPDFQFTETNNIMSAGRLMASHLLTLLLPKQTERISLQALYSDDSLVNQNFALGANALYHGDQNAAQQYLELALQAKPNYFWANAYLAESLYKSGELARASELVARLQTESIDPRENIFLSNLQANILYSFGKIEASNEVSKALIERAKKEGFDELVGILSMNTGTSYSALGNTQDAIRFLQSSIDIFVEGGFKLREGQARLNLANAYYLQDQLSPEAVEQYSLAEKLFRQFNAKGYLAFALTSQMHLKIDRNRFAQAESIMDEIDQIYQQIGDREGQILLIAERANIAMKQGQLELARNFLKEALSEATAEFSFARSHVARLLSLVGLNMGDITLAKESYEVAKESQWQDNRAIFILIPAFIAHAENDIQRAIELAQAVKTQLGANWLPVHEVYLTMFIEDINSQAPAGIDYIQGKRR